MTKLSEPVRTPSGEVTTISALDAEGRITWRKVDNWRYRTTPIYFADIDGATTGWPISEYAYKSRMARSRPAPEPLPEPSDPHEVMIDQTRADLRTWLEKSSADLIEQVDDALSELCNTGKCPINPPVMGALVELDVLQNRTRRFIISNAYQAECEAI